MTTTLLSVLSQICPCPCPPFMNIDYETHKKNDSGPMAVVLKTQKQADALLCNDSCNIAFFRNRSSLTTTLPPQERMGEIKAIASSIPLFPVYSNPAKNESVIINIRDDYSDNPRKKSEIVALLSKNSSHSSLIYSSDDEWVNVVTSV
ncbi:MAG: hypothetical protein ACI9S8_001969 [Chlamydiales bacterium]|jgi:hypothetical protein